ncbi:hypothetical protein DPEC_G00087070 [Dallia pectoralis]|uniref:Uncharacterized protein n=1 Tax=Dallia pectoralis TaxID=75939 RepID=A0ACC2H0B2_DALPE|nr:hypothetical protein DPEC_G00087070 [Dallia pectoralis]
MAVEGDTFIAKVVTHFMSRNCLSPRWSKLLLKTANSRHTVTEVEGLWCLSRYSFDLENTCSSGVPVGTPKCLAERPGRGSARANPPSGSYT